MDRQLNIKPCSEAEYQLFTRVIVMVAGISVGGVFMSGSMAQSDGTLVFGLLLIVLAFWPVFSYVELDADGICHAFRIGRFFHWRYGSVSWENAVAATVHPAAKGLVDLSVVTRSGRQLRFSVPRDTTGAARFYDIAHEFQRRA